MAAALVVAVAGAIGGAFASAAGQAASSGDDQLAEDHGVVVVTVNHRLGPFGFLAHPDLSAEGGVTASGDYGAHDQLAALRWVRENAIAFGGDPERITVFGESAGSVSTCRVVTSPLAKGLVHRAVLMSGGCVAMPHSAAERTIIQVAEALGCGDARDAPACMRAASTARVMATLDPMANGTDHLGRGTYDGVIDGYLLPDAPAAPVEAGLHSAVPVMLGTTSAENGRSAPPIATDAARFVAAQTEPPLPVLVRPRPGELPCRSQGIRGVPRQRAAVPLRGPRGGRRAARVISSLRRFRKRSSPQATIWPTHLDSGCVPCTGYSQGIEMAACGAWSTRGRGQRAQGWGRPGRARLLAGITRVGQSTGWPSD